MAIWRLWACFIILSLIFVPKSESSTRTLVEPQQLLGNNKKEVTETLMRELLQKSRELAKKSGINQGRYYTNRRSPGGPDPKHHSQNLRWLNLGSGVVSGGLNDPCMSRSAHIIMLITPWWPRSLRRKKMYFILLFSCCD